MRNSCLCLLAMLTFAYSCQKKIDQPQTNLSANNVNKGILAWFKSAGFDTKGIGVTPDNYVLEGDMLIDKKTVQAAMNSKNGASGSSTNNPVNKITPDQYGINAAASSDGTGIISWVNTQNIPYYIDPSVTGLTNGADWANAIVTATQNWTNIPNCAVSFVQVNAAASAQIVFYSAASANVPGGATALGASTYAASRFPQNGFIGSYVIINPTGPASSATGKVSIMQHEIGHTLGMRHSNALVDGEGTNGVGLQGQVVNGANLFNDTPSDDTQSLMFASYNGTATLGFDTYDNYAAQQLYPDNTAPGFSFGWIPNNRNLRDVEYLYVQTHGNFWFSMKLERMDNSGTIVSTNTYIGPDSYWNTAYRVATDYSGINGNIDRNWRITVYNFKQDFSFVTTMTSPTFY
ncbi:MAG TPA: M57 family metalloprotease [Puia sp.]|nr:M57 family metalloprotease [Puia sp.]